MSAPSRSHHARPEPASPASPRDRPGTEPVARGLDRRVVLDALEREIGRIVAPTLLALPGVGPDTAATLLIAAGDNPERLRSEATFANLCGVAPIPASSGKTTRHRLNRGGNRDANRALFVVALTRMGHDQRTRDYVARRTAEGCSKREILRCLIGRVSGVRPVQEQVVLVGRRPGDGLGAAPPDGQFEFCRP